MNIPQETYKEIEAIIASEKSVVGIDAKKTHILILYQMMEMEKRMARLEALVEELISANR